MSLGILCSACGSGTRVIDSRPMEGADGAGIRRRRECLACGKRCTSIETLVTASAGRDVVTIGSGTRRLVAVSEDRVQVKLGKKRSSSTGGVADLGTLTLYSDGSCSVTTKEGACLYWRSAGEPKETL